MFNKTKILVLASNYPGPGLPAEMTKVVHFFVREWINYGVEVDVVHTHTVFPLFEYPIIYFLRHKLYAKSGVSFPSRRLFDTNYTIDGVKVYRRCIYKAYPSSKFCNISKFLLWGKISKLLKSNNYNLVVAHWDEPNLYLLNKVKEKFNLKTAFIVHGVPPFSIVNREILNSIDVIGFRSFTIKKEFESVYKLNKENSFMCFSGIPEDIISDEVAFELRAHSILYVGGLIKRKYPDIIIDALSQNRSFNYTVNFVGDGGMRPILEQLIVSKHLEKRAFIMGRKSRFEVFHLMRNSMIFIMISKAETFGLVYIEAMAQGCIVIGSKNEGIDGIIINEKNGFLCNPGDSIELCEILRKIDNLSPLERQSISNAAIDTAKKLTDKNVSLLYLESIL